MGNIAQVIEWRRRTKQKLIDCFGGSCNKCGYNRCLGALDFHHLEQYQKEHSISKLLVTCSSWDKLCIEVEKCIILCCRCHQELHHNLWSLNDIRIKRFENLFPQQTFKKDIPTGICPQCKESVYLGNKFCSYKCVGKYRHKIAWPSNEELLLMYRQESCVSLSKKLNVSDVAIHKRVKRLLAGGETR